MQLSVEARNMLSLPWWWCRYSGPFVCVFFLSKFFVGIIFRFKKRLHKQHQEFSVSFAFIPFCLIVLNWHKIYITMFLCHLWLYKVFKSIQLSGLKYICIMCNCCHQPEPSHIPKWNSFNTNSSFFPPLSLWQPPFCFQFVYI
jgi:hypothetical protein